MMMTTNLIPTVVMKCFNPNTTILINVFEYFQTDRLWDLIKLGKSQLYLLMICTASIMNHTVMRFPRNIDTYQTAYNFLKSFLMGFWWKFNCLPPCYEPPATWKKSGDWKYLLIFAFLLTHLLVNYFCIVPDHSREHSIQHRNGPSWSYERYSSTIFLIQK